ncbi:sigma-70 family RNA polymerase sigma factor [Solicola sp. PLA-1-18]|uniref:sigma-70 family RNA polymerase sigma factor n=1 Tax=Solicola sp. PLA-1-18 TaxID=3380532 RepID=UPI003B78F243
MTPSLGLVPASVVDTAPDALVRQHMPLVRRLVREVCTRIPSHVDRDDLTGTGMATLVVAARAWDPSRGVTFERYAAIRVRGALLDELRGLDWATRSVRRRAREVEQTRNRLAAELGRVPSAAELAAATGLTTQELASHADDVARSSVLSLQGFDDRQADDLDVRRAPAADTIIEKREQIAYLQDAVATLPERLRVVVEGWFIHERPMAEIAVELGVSESRISQMRAEALVLLKDALNTHLAPELVSPTDRPGGCAARRRETYFADVASRRTYRERLAGEAMPTSA